MYIQMLKIAVCDDDGFEAVLISTYLREYQKLHTTIDLHYDIFQSATDLYHCLDSGKRYDIYLLDIIMPDIDGLTLGKKMRELNIEGTIIYLTSSKDYALDAFQVYALQYLVKPISLETFCETMDKAIGKFDDIHAPTYTINSVNGSYKVHYSSIVYIECSKHTLCFHLSDGTEITSKNIRVPFEVAIEELLADSRFIRIHQSYVVNLSYAENLNHLTFTVDCGGIMKNLPISRNRFSEVKKIYSK